MYTWHNLYRRAALLLNGPLFRVGSVLAFLVIAGEGCQSVPKDGATEAESASPESQLEMASFFASYCYNCHDADLNKGDIDLATMMETDGRITDGELLDRIVRVLSAGEMPPKKKKQPAAEELASLLTILEEAQAEKLAAIKPQAGRVTVRRLNRMEYNNTVRDLLGVTSKPSVAFPPDDTGYGFDNIGDVLSLSPLLAEKYLDAAEDIAAEAMASEVATYDSTLPIHRKILICDHSSPEHDRACAERIVKDLTPRAYRRPASRDEVEALMGFYTMATEGGESFYEALELVLQAVLVSPHFLFRVEEAQAPKKPDAEYRVNNYEFISRLSYFIWSSMPDEELMACAQDGSIWNPRTLRGQVRRMLRDPRARALAENFGGQWLETRNLVRADPDPEQFSEFTDELREAMAEETTLFFDSIVSEDRSILDFIDADYTYVNKPLADLYGIEGIIGDEFVRVAVNTEERGGILGQASILTLTSHPARTSPVLRGVWILNKVLAAPSPPPPPGVPALEETEIDGAASLREKLEAHRANVSCASCHDRIDPLGFGLENYGPIGAWRSEENGKPLDNTGVLPDGREFAGPGELKKVLLERKSDFARCLSEKMLTYALGRGLEAYDAPAVAAIVNQVEKNDFRFSALVYEIVRSLPFMKQRGEMEAV